MFLQWGKDFVSPIRGLLLFCSFLIKDYFYSKGSKVKTMSIQIDIGDGLHVQSS